MIVHTVMGMPVEYAAADRYDEHRHRNDGNSRYP